MLQLDYYLDLIQKGYRLSILEIAKNVIPQDIRLIVNTTEEQIIYDKINTKSICNPAVSNYFESLIVTNYSKIGKHLTIYTREGLKI